MDLSGKLNDPALRIKYTLESVGEWLKREPSMQIVICDGSGFDYSYLIKKHFPGASIECLSLMNDALQIKIHGKGFGEGEIIRHALRHSLLLGQSDVFIKCTAKLWVDNFQDCLAQWNNFFVCGSYFANVFSLKKTKPVHADTRFYISRKDVYLRYFSNAHSELGKAPKASIEHTFLKIIVENKIEHVFFRRPQVVCGMGGGSGKYYKHGKIRILKDRLRNWIVRSSSEYKKLFCIA